MKYYCLVKEGEAYEGTTLKDIILQITEVILDYNKRSVFIGYTKRIDTITYSREYTDIEFEKEAFKRVCTILIRNGWRLYQDKRY